MKAIQKIMPLSLLLISGLYYHSVLAQSALQADGNWHTLSYSGSYIDYTVPSSVTYPYLEFRVVGADGGSARVTGCDRVAGGAGAIVTAILEIGTTDKQVPPAGTLRFIVGQGGEEMNLNQGGGAGGGGGSAVLLKVSGQTDPYRILAVAGGGGGGWASHGGFNNCLHDPGNSAQSGTSGGSADGEDDNKGTPGSDGQGAYQPTDLKYYGGGGGGAFSNAYYSNQKTTMTSSGLKGVWNGGAGGWQNDPAAGSQNIKGGYGFGGGGGGYARDPGNLLESSSDAGAGGGGGYSGGANGSDGCDDVGCGSAGGGGSYLDPNVYSGRIEIGDRTTTTHDGYIQYRFVKFVTMHLASDTSKCLDIASESIDNGTNIQLGALNGAQVWYVDGMNFRLAKYLNKCIDLSQGNTTNANNIQLWDCNNSDSQHWVYDGINKMIRSQINTNKCIHVRKNMTAVGSNIYIYDCSPGSTAQVWLLDDVSTMPPDTKVVTIRSELDANKCLDLDNGNTSNGANIQLWDCVGSVGNSNQQWYFDGLAIKLAKNPAKCIDVSNSNTNNGANIQLFDCNNTEAQQWVYDGRTKEFKSSINLNKCIDVNQSGTANGTNFQLYDCNGTSAQHFTLDAVPCVMDSTPPVAKCKNAHFTQLMVPDASDIDNGSYDNCSIKSMDVRNADQDGVFILTVTDSSGNSCSCTASVSFN